MKFIEFLILSKYIQIALSSISDPNEETRIPGLSRRRRNFIKLEFLKIPKEFTSLNEFIKEKIGDPEFELFVPENSTFKYSRENYEPVDPILRMFKSEIRIFNDYFEMTMAISFDSSCPMSYINLENISRNYDLYFDRVDLSAIFNKKKRFGEILKIRRAWFEDYYVWANYMVNEIEKYLHLIIFGDNLKSKL